MAAKDPRQPKRQQKSVMASKKRAKTQHTLRNNKKAGPSIDKSTNTEQPTGSAARLFGTTKLLEQVLLNIGTLNGLMTLRRVCRGWQAVIEDTPSLQRLIFLAPQPSDHEWHGDDRNNPFWEQWLPTESLLVKKPTGSAPNAGKEVRTSARINPLLFYKQPEHDAIPIWHQQAYYPDYRAKNDWSSQELYLRMEKKPKGIKINSPLFRMFATQPPLEAMSFRVYEDGYRSTRDIRNSKGLKVIDILRAAESLEGRKAVVVNGTIFPPEDQQTMRITSHKDNFPDHT